MVGSAETITDVCLALSVAPSTAVYGTDAMPDQVFTRVNGGEERSWSYMFNLITNGQERYVYDALNAVLAFTDAAGNRWCREKDHTLTLIRRA
jgi:hypothetical protein